ncbi:MAG: hypothetical protein ACI35V_01910 [Sphingobacterium composti]|uniref:hypothetical protein n=1 Tax=Sphingobacterium composti TaxID=363260 RepID=UPI001358B22D|nr:hypothetical protein [Sphingobacterium composti Ten et al. 2007 non Yoo et al. 2007]
MKNFISHLFSEKEKVDIEKLQLAADLSFHNAKNDPYLLSLAAEQQRLDVLQEYFSCVKDIDSMHKILLNEEIINVQALISAYQILQGERINIRIQNNIPPHSEFKIEPFILFPIIQNAIQYGYNSLEKYPLRVKFNLVGNSLKFEVSNRVNHNIENQSSTSILINLGNRLRLKCPDNHTVLYNSNTMIFKVTLLLY